MGKKGFSSGKLSLIIVCRCERVFIFCRWSVTVDPPRQIPLLLPPPPPPLLCQSRRRRHFRLDFWVMTYTAIIVTGKLMTPAESYVSTCDHDLWLLLLLLLPFRSVKEVKHYGGKVVVPIQNRNHSVRSYTHTQVKHLNADQCACESSSCWKRV